MEKLRATSQAASI